MIKYKTGSAGVFFIARRRGSVFPKAFCWAIPNAALAIILHLYCRGIHELDMTGVDWVWAGYTSVLGFLLTFRNNQAYTRFWEGATLINQVRGEWFNAVSTLFAFCNQSKDHVAQVQQFQSTLVRLASMLYCSALQQVCDLEDDRLEIIDNSGMDADSRLFLCDSNDRCEIILQWIQRLIVDSEESRTIKIAPPLLTRAFQELSRGIVNLNNARKIKDIPFPFPYAQMMTVMLIVHWMVTPLIASQVMESRMFAGVMCFFVTFAFWCLIYIALEIDQPFGEDDNDLPLREMQRDFNNSLLRLMEPLAQKVPIYQAASAEDPKRPMVSMSDSTRVSNKNPGEHDPDDPRDDLELSRINSRKPTTTTEGSPRSAARRRSWNLAEAFHLNKSSSRSRGLSDQETQLDVIPDGSAAGREEDMEAAVLTAPEDTEEVPPTLPLEPRVHAVPAGEKACFDGKNRVVGMEQKRPGARKLEAHELPGDVKLKLPETTSTQAQARPRVQTSVEAEDPTGDAGQLKVSRTSATTSTQVSRTSATTSTQATMEYLHLQSDKASRLSHSASGLQDPQDSSWTL